jgi:hypothetical protein
MAKQGALTSSSLDLSQLLDNYDMAFGRSTGRIDNMKTLQPEVGIDEYLRKRLTPAEVIREHQNEPAKAICNAILAHTVRQDEHLLQLGEEDRVDDKTVFVIKRTQ